AERISVIGNYPYNISSQIFFHILDFKDLIPCCAGMLQREVAERLAAAPGTKARGILSVLLQAWYDVEYLFTVSEGVFNPPPKVKSGVIRLTRNSRTELGVDAALFKSVVKTTFGQRRKTIRNSIKALCADFPSDHPLAGKRPEQLSVEEFIELTAAVRNRG
ncbi:MAG: 16S rRNA (adenine(1518)-N(6)/adenine(1519)-N(6))-dimethyltransferase, partial [Muribaculaceae bacterium]|nr:16S rRNA (adenine(1518)-N(6)/adenine(1519)-N(6))-dimethyltransferase [Muribaculaceae bacterium]